MPDTAEKIVSLSNLSRFKDKIDALKQDTLVSGTNIKTINDTTVLGSGNFNLATKLEHLKALYHLGAYDYAGTSNADYDVVTRGTIWLNSKSGWTRDSDTGGYARFYILIDKSNASNSITSNYPIVGDYAASSGAGVCLVDNGDGHWLVGYKVAATGNACVPEDLEIQLQKTQDYDERVLKNQPISQLDQNGENWLRGEYEKTLNLFDLGFSSWSNAIADTKDYFNLALRINGLAVAAKYIDSIGVCSLTFTTPSSVDTWSMLHSGQSVDIWIVQDNTKCPLKPNTTYTLSFNVIGYNPSSVGGLSISNIMLNDGDTAKPFVEYNGPIMHAIDVKGVLLWENADTNTEFESETFAVSNMGGYSKIVFAYKDATGSTNNVCYKEFAKIVGAMGLINIMQTTPSKVFASRQFIIESDTSITFGNGWEEPLKKNNSLLIPVAVYGIK